MTDGENPRSVVVPETTAPLTSSLYEYGSSEIDGIAGVLARLDRQVTADITAAAQDGA